MDLVGRWLCSCGIVVNQLYYAAMLLLIRRNHELLGDGGVYRDGGDECFHNRITRKDIELSVGQYVPEDIGVDFQQRFNWLFWRTTPAWYALMA